MRDANGECEDTRKPLICKFRRLGRQKRAEKGGSWTASRVAHTNYHLEIFISLKNFMIIFLLFTAFSPAEEGHETVCREHKRIRRAVGTHFRF